MNHTDAATAKSRPGPFFRALMLAAMGFALAGLTEAADMTVSAVHVFHHVLNGTEGKEPGAVLVLPDGTLYGTTLEGGTNGAGTVFSISTGGQLVTLHSFGGPDGSFPDACLVAGADAGIYGTTGVTGVESLLRVKRVFRITKGGDFSVAVVMYPPALSGSDFWSALIYGSDGRQYALTNSDNSAFSLVSQMGGAVSGHTFQVVNSSAAGGGRLFLDKKSAALVMAQARRDALGGAPGIPPHKEVPTQCGDIIVTGDGHFWQPPGILRSISTDLREGYYWPVRDNPASAEANSAYGRFAAGPRNSIWATTADVVVAATQGNDLNYVMPRGVVHVTRHNELIEVTPTGVIARRVSLELLGKIPTPFGGLINGPDGNIYGLADAGSGVVILFRLDSGGAVEIVHRFVNTGGTWGLPRSALVAGRDGNMYINFPRGGQYNQGIIYRISIARH